jgi:uncharacterized protein (TIGR02246 family)
MRTAGRSIAVCLGVILSIGCNREPKAVDVPAAAGAIIQASAGDIVAIRGITTSWFANYNAHHADSLAALYADDAVLMMPGAPSVKGRDAIKAAYAKDMAAMEKSGYTNNQGKDSNVMVSGDIGWESNVFRVTDKAGKQIGTGKYVTVFARKDGKWLIVRDIWNMDSPSSTT